MSGSGTGIISLPNMFAIPILALLVCTLEFAMTIAQLLFNSHDAAK